MREADIYRAALEKWGADVQIMLEQMIALHNCRAMVRTYKAAKLDRLKERLGLGEVET
jgi:hypothetical protein